VAAVGAVPASASIYRSGAGQMRPSDVRPAADSGGNGVLSVQRMLDSATLALPDTADFIFHPYEVRFTPDYVSRPTIGYTRDNFGRGIFGGSTVQLSDMLGNHTMLFSGMVNGRLSEAQVEAVYINSARRWNWAVGVSQQPLFLYGNSTYETGTGPAGGDVLTERLFRYIFREAFVQSSYPINQFRRIELGMSFTNIGRSWLNMMTEVDPNTGYPTGNYGETVTDTTSITIVQPRIALVKDNSLFGYTSNFYGERYRLEIAPSFGGWQYTQFTADYRRYQMLIFPASFSFRAMAIGRLGRDGGIYPSFIGYPDMVRGYTFASYTSADCSAPTSQTTGFSTGCPELDQLLGSRIAVFNAEFRFPLVRSLTLGFLPVGFPPIEAAIFYDAGIAWNANSAVHLSRPANADLAVDRWPMTSYGIGARINLFGFTVLRIDYAVPLQRSRGGYWIVSLGPPF
jgi:hypothetical protein